GHRQARRLRLRRLPGAAGPGRGLAPLLSAAAPFWSRERGDTAAVRATRTGGPRVMKLVGAPWTPERPIMSAVLDGGPGTVASYRAAAALWRLPGFDLSVLECSRERGHTSRRASIGTLHLPRWLPPQHVTEVAGVATTSLAR